MAGSIIAKRPRSPLHLGVFTIDRIIFATQTCLRAAILSLLVATAASAQSLTLAWDPPSDGDTVGYILSYGTTSKKYTQSVNVGFALTYTVKNLASDTGYCFAVRAYDADGLKSDYSSEVCAKTAPTAPTAPVEEDPPPASSDPLPAKEIVRYAHKGKAYGHWGVAASTGAAESKSMRSTNTGWSATSAPLKTPTHYFDVQFDAAAGTAYRIWLRLRAASNSKWNDAVWVQFSGSLVDGQPAYRMGTTSGLLVNLERCSGCSMSGWGWFNSAYWLRQQTIVTFAQSGPQTMRIQTREDGVEIDQVVLSAVKYMTQPPGPALNDTTILPATSGTTAPSEPTSPPPDEPTAPATTGTPYTGTPIAIPGTVQAAYFDNGASNVAYWDSTSGNSGRVFRTTDVDLQTSVEGGYNVGWTSAGEWLTYTINVSQSGTYYATLRVASEGGGTMEISSGAPSNSKASVSVPNTGGWQRWMTVKVPIKLAAGKQVLRVRFVSGGVNFRKVDLNR
jgi:hypothetical protein